MPFGALRTPPNRVEPSSGHPPKVTGDVDGLVTGGLDVDDQALGSVVVDERRHVAVGGSRRMDNCLDTVPRNRPDTCTSHASGSSRLHVPGVSRVYSLEPLPR